MFASNRTGHAVKRLLRQGAPKGRIAHELSRDHPAERVAACLRRYPDALLFRRHRPLQVLLCALMGAWAGVRVALGLTTLPLDGPARSLAALGIAGVLLAAVFALRLVGDGDRTGYRLVAAAALLAWLWQVAHDRAALEATGGPALAIASSLLALGVAALALILHLRLHVWPRGVDGRGGVAD